MVHSSLSYQMQMLYYAASIVLPIEYVELGNELYTSGEDQTGQDYVNLYSTGVAYANDANTWISAIKADFPLSRVSVVGAAYSKNANARRSTWNEDVISTIQNADAITIHPYAGIGIPDTLPDSELFLDQNIQKMLIASDTQIKQMVNNDFSILPANMRVWITEYNLLKDGRPIHGTWAHALYIANMTMMLAEQSKVDMLLFYGLIGSAVFGAAYATADGFKNQNVSPIIPNAPKTKVYSLSACGEVLQMLARIINSNSRLITLQFYENPKNLIRGWQVESQNKKAEIILNLTEKITYLNHAPTKVEQLVASPEFRSAEQGQINRVSKISSGSSVTLPAYSISVLTY